MRKRMLTGSVSALLVCGCATTSVSPGAGGRNAASNVLAPGYAMERLHITHWADQRKRTVSATNNEVFVATHFFRDYLLFTSGSICYVVHRVAGRDPKIVGVCD